MSEIAAQDIYAGLSGLDLQLDTFDFGEGAAN